MASEGLRIKVTSEVVLTRWVEVRRTGKREGRRNRQRDQRNRPCDLLRTGESGLAVGGVWEGCLLFCLEWDASCLAGEKRQARQANQRHSLALESWLREGGHTKQCSGEAIGKKV
jgi:hypothetical protein